MSFSIEREIVPSQEDYFLTACTGAALLVRSNHFTG